MSPTGATDTLTVPPAPAVTTTAGAFIAPETIMDPEERQARDARERLAAEIAAHLCNPDLIRELVEDHILGLTFECRSVDIHGQVHCHETPVEEEEAPA